MPRDSSLGGGGGGRVLTQIVVAELGYNIPRWSCGCLWQSRGAGSRCTGPVSKQKCAGEGRTCCPSGPPCHSLGGRGPTSVASGAACLLKPAQMHQRCGQPSSSPPTPRKITGHSFWGRRTRIQGSRKKKPPSQVCDCLLKRFILSPCPNVQRQEEYSLYIYIFIYIYIKKQGTW